MKASTKIIFVGAIIIIAPSTGKPFSKQVKIYHWHYVLKSSVVVYNNAIVCLAVGVVCASLLQIISKCSMHNFVIQV